MVNDTFSRHFTAGAVNAVGLKSSIVVMIVFLETGSITKDLKGCGTVSYEKEM